MEKAYSLFQLLKHTCAPIYGIVSCRTILPYSRPDTYPRIGRYWYKHFSRSIVHNWNVPVIISLFLKIPDRYKMATNAADELANATQASQESVKVKEEPTEEAIQPSEEVDCKNSLAEGFSRLFDEESTSDVTLVVGSKCYFAHKTVLSASSEYFYHMFYGAQWRESVLDEIVLHESPACIAVLILLSVIFTLES